MDEIHRDLDRFLRKGSDPNRSLADDPPSAKRRKIKQQVRAKHLAAAFSSPDPAAAVIGVINNDLFGLALSYSEVLENAIQSMPKSLETWDQLQRHKDGYLRLTRQIQRNTDLELRATKEAKKRSFDTQTDATAAPDPDAQPPKTVGGAKPSDAAPTSSADVKPPVLAGQGPVEDDEDDDDDIYEDAPDGNS